VRRGLVAALLIFALGVFALASWILAFSLNQLYGYEGIKAWIFAILILAVFTGIFVFLILFLLSQRKNILHFLVDFPGKIGRAYILAIGKFLLVFFRFAMRFVVFPAFVALYIVLAFWIQALILKPKSEISYSQEQVILFGVLAATAAKITLDFIRYIRSFSGIHLKKLEGLKVNIRFTKEYIEGLIRTVINFALILVSSASVYFASYTIIKERIPEAEIFTVLTALMFAGIIFFYWIKSSKTKKGGRVQ
jgi:hypothetical protein